MGRQKVREADLDLGRLCIAIQRARLTLRRQRQVRVDMVRDFAGPYWGPELDGFKSQPINLLALYVSVFSRALIAQNPRAMFKTFISEHKPAVMTMQDWANDEMRRTDFKGTMTRIILDAFFMIGIGKVAIADPGDAALNPWGLAAGQPYFQSVDPDDWVYDVHARYLPQAGFAGHRIRVPRDEVVKSGLYGKGGHDLTPTEDRFYNLEGDEKISLLGRGMYGDQEEYEDFIDLWEIYLPRKGVVVTLYEDYIIGAGTSQDLLQKAGDYKAKALRQQKWIGPKTGPYHYLSYVTVPGNALAKGPIQDVYDLHSAVNNIFRKLIRQAKDQKKVTLYDKSSPEDAKRIAETSDGEMVGVTRPDAVQEVELRGPNNQNYVLGNDLIQRLSWLSGNLETMAGLSPQAKTAHQEAVLNQNSAGLLGDMQATTVDFTSKVLRGLAWLWHYHPSLVMKAPYTVPGTPHSIMRHVGPGGLPTHPETGQRWDPESGAGFGMTRDHDFEDMHVEIDPYSLVHKTPEARLQAIAQVLTQIQPMLQMAQQQGVTLDLRALLDKLAKYMDEPDIQEILKYQEPIQEGEAGGGGDDGGGGMPAETKRTYVRENMPGRTQQGDQMNLRNALMGVETGGMNKASKPMGG